MTVRSNGLHAEYLWLENYKVTDVEEAKGIAAEILKEQHDIHKRMIKAAEAEDNDLWKSLSDTHFDLRKIRQRILNEAGKLAMKLKREGKR